MPSDTATTLRSLESRTTVVSAITTVGAGVSNVPEESRASMTSDWASLVVWKVSESGSRVTLTAMGSIVTPTGAEVTAPEVARTRTVPGRRAVSMPESEIMAAGSDVRHAIGWAAST